MAADSMGGAGGAPTGSSGRIASDARWLAAAAAGLVAAVLALLAFRGLPGGAIALWASPLPLFLAGIGFGGGAALLAVAIASLAILFSSNTLGFGLFLGAFGAPVAALVLSAGRGATADLRLPFALLGVIPAFGIALAAFQLAGEPGGLEGAMRHAAEIGLARMGLPAPEAMVAELVRVKAAAIGFWVAIALLVNAAAAGALLVRLGVVAEAPRWREARLPGWYLALPAVAALLWLLADDGADAVPLSLLLALLVPVFLHGLAAFHRATRGLSGRAMVMGGAYAALLLMAVPVALAATGYGLFDILNANRGRPAPPPHS
jgi:hypothetical protein